MPLIGDIILVVLIALIVVLVVVFLRILWRHEQHDAAMTVLSQTTYESALEKGEHKAEEIVGEALHQARDMLVEAEIASIKHTAKEKVAGRKLHEEYEAALAEVARDMRQHFETYSTQAAAAYQELIATFKHETQHYLVSSRTELERAVSEQTREVTQTFRALEHHARTKVEEVLAVEMEQTRTAIEAYRTERLAMIDEHIMRLVARTTERTLGEGLDVKAHKQLMYRALEQAKEETFF